MAIRLYEEAAHASAYARYRPHYSMKVRDLIKSFMEKHGCGFDCIVDVATGSGQALTHWTEMFHKCVGVDISGEQIKNARTAFQEKGVKNVELHVSPAEDLPLSSSSCDLVSCATAWHWLDADKFYSEATRVLRQPGVLAVYSHGIPFFPNNPEATSLTMKLYDEKLSKVWHPNTRHIVNHYKEVELPYPVTERHDILQEWPIPLSHYVSYLGTLATYQKYLKEYPGDAPLDELYQELKEAFSVTDTDPIVECAFPLFIILGAKMHY